MRLAGASRVGQVTPALAVRNPLAPHLGSAHFGHAAYFFHVALLEAGLALGLRVALLRLHSRQFLSCISHVNCKVRG